MATINHKRGDTFDFLFTAENNGVAIDLTGYTITSQARASDDTVLQSFTVTITSAVNGQFTLTAAVAATELWTPGAYNMDIEFVDGSGVTVSTQTFTLNVIADVTR